MGSLFDGLIHAWKLEVDARDSVGDAHGTVNGATNVSAKVGGGYSFNGSSNDIDVGVHSDLSFGDGAGNDQPFSISLWMKPDTIQTSFAFAKSDDGISQREYALALLGTNQRIEIRLVDDWGVNVLYGYVDNGYRTGEWQHVLWTYDGSKTFAGNKLYLNGKEVTMIDNSIGTYNGMTNYSVPLKIGARKDGGGIDFPFDGDLDEIFIWNRVLSAGEVRTLYGAASDRLRSGLIAHWNLDQSNPNAPYVGYNFAGGTDHIRISDHDDFSFTDGAGNDEPFSLSFKYKHTNAGDGGQILTKRDTTVGWEWSASHGGSNFAFQLATDASNWISCTAPAALGELHHAVVTYDGSNSGSGVRIWIDGVEQTVTIQNIGSYAGMSNTAVDLVMGGILEGGSIRAGNMLIGALSDARIWGKELTPAEVADIFNNEDVTDSLISHWKLDGDATDSQGSHDGTVNGPTPYRQLAEEAIDLLGQHTGLIKGSPAYVAGKLHDALDFNGTTDYIEVPDNDRLSFTDGNDKPFSLSAWVNYSSTGATQVIASKWLFGTGFEWAFMMLPSGNPGLWLRNSTGSEEIYAYSSAAMSVGVWHHVAITYDGSESNSGIKTYVDGVLQTMTTGGGTYNGMSNTSAPVRIGVRNNGGTLINWLDGSMDEVLLWERELSAVEVKQLYRIADGALLLAPINQDLISYWPLDANANDLLNKNHGIVNGATLTPSGGKIDGCYAFDGINDYIEIADSNDLSFTDGAGNDKPFSVECWFKPATTNVGILISKWFETQKEWALNYNAGGLLSFGCRHIDASAQLFEYANTTPVSVGVWHHVIGTYDGSETNDGLNIYLDGVLIPSVPSNEGVYTGMTNSTAPVRIGTRNSTPDLPFQGLIDEVAIYGRELTAQEVLKRYNAGSGRKLSIGKKDGLLAHYDLNVDASDRVQSNDGTLNGTTLYKSRMGNGRRFNGSSDYISFSEVPNIGAKDLSVSLWFKSSDLSAGFKMLFALGTETANNLVQFYKENGSNQLRWSLWGYTPSNTLLNGVFDDAWHHVVGTLSGGNTLKLYVDGKFIGQDTQSYNILTGAMALGRTAQTAGNYFNGMLDDVTIFDRELSESEVLSLANSRSQREEVKSGLIAYWPFEGDTADEFGNHHGTATGTTEVDGVFGGKARQLNGSSDFIEVADSDEFSFTDGAGNDKPFSFSTWFKLGLEGKDVMIMSKHGATNTAEYYFSYGGLTTDNFQWIMYTHPDTGHIRIDTTGVGPLNVGQWYHLVGTYDGSNSPTGLKVYLDGNLLSNTPTTFGTYTGMSNKDASVILGARRNRITGTPELHFNGVLDESMFFNRELTQAEVTALYENNSLLQTNLISYLPFGDDVKDKSGNKNHGTASGTTIVEDGRIGKARAFNGTSDYIDCSVLPGFAEAINGDGGTWSFWIRTTQTSNQFSTGYVDTSIGDRIGANFNHNNNNQLVFMRLQDGLAGTDVFDTQFSTVPFNDGEWHHITFRMKTGVDRLVELWMDGVKYSGTVVNNNDVTLVQSSLGFMLGSINIDGAPSAPNYFNGDMSDVLFIGRWISDSEIRQLASARGRSSLPNVQRAGRFLKRVKGIDTRHIKKIGEQTW